ncbi:MarR family winged helix-turn-helix transcriptional regulator [Lysinibacillus odysseyi]|uniref:MarR family transcriptional regulator n=1 Tax=Lysinibacillus odysseyi 34hs-1 = NBRC 100172 TaxID=1220589 RepID=A0A0A3IAY2_9BACI|nr:MarR family transcriptional regulator [Lysinibacillus odysseyi]KGR81916.1 MarR family transcriptional regulator [Lysinibacillus odysseyi 34hs-1 = NBRC 100172]
MEKPSIYELINMVEQVNNASIIKFTEGLSQPIGISAVIVLSEVKKSCRCKPIDLAKKLGYSKSSITAISNKLMDAGYIARTEDQHDRRTVYFTITDKGNAILKEVEVLGQDYYKTIYSVLSEEELHQYIQIQRKLLNHIKNK